MAVHHDIDSSCIRTRINTIISHIKRVNRGDLVSDFKFKKINPREYQVNYQLTCIDRTFREINKTEYHTF